MHGFDADAYFELEGSKPSEVVAITLQDEQLLWIVKDFEAQRADAFSALLATAAGQEGSELES